MLNQANWLDPILVNSIGHTAALLVFGLIIVLLVQDWQTQRVQQTKLPLIAAVLALGWNVGSLIALGTQDQNALWIGFVMTASFAILSLLPAVLLQVVLQGRYTPIVLAGYAVSVVAVGLHFSELLFPSTPFHQAALVVIAVGFGLLTVIAFLETTGRSQGRRGRTTGPNRIGLSSTLRELISSLRVPTCKFSVGGRDCVAPHWYSGCAGDSPAGLPLFTPGHVRSLPCELWFGGHLCWRSAHPSPEVSVLGCYA